MKKLAAFMITVAAVMAAAPALAVTFGSPDGNGHPFVGTILFKQPSGYYSCTATLMGPTVMMTAGHCTEEGGVTNLKTWVSFEPVINVHTGCGGVPACLDAYFDNPANGWIKGTAHPHPQYDDFSQFPATYDVGVVVLQSPVVMSTYGALPPIGFLKTIGPKNNRFTVVGYGMQGYIPAFNSDIWARYVGTVKLVELNSTYNGGFSAKYTNNPGAGGGTCYGDSGGPIFYGDTNVVTSVVSFGVTPCIGVDYNFRTDLQTTQDFVKSFLDGVSGGDLI
jgi:hypothetical protein